MKEAGLAVGLTVSGPRQAETVVRALELGLFDAVQATWNLLERSTSEVLGRAHAAGLVVIVKEALANGRLTARGGENRLLGIARELGQTPDAIALSAVLAQPWADVVLSGAASVETLYSNLSALEVGYDEELDRRLEPLSEERDRYCTERGRLRWS